MLPYVMILSTITIIFYITNKFFLKEIKINGHSYYKYNTAGLFFLTFSYILFILFTVFRVIDINHGGIDAFVYKQYFLNSHGSWLEALMYQNYEWGYSTIIWFIRLFTEEYRFVLLFIYSLLFVLLAFFTKYLTWNKYTILSMFLIAGLLINSFNTQRVIIAVFIGMLIYVLLYKKRYLLSFILSLVAISIHISAIILFPIILVTMLVTNKNKVRFKKLIIYIVLITVASVVLLRILTPIILGSKYSIYIDGQGLAVGTYSIILIIFILSVIKYKKMVEINAFNKTLITILPMGLIIIPLQMEFPILYRMLLYFFPIIYSLIPPLIKVYSVTNIKQAHYFIIKFVLLFYVLVRFYNFLVIELESAGFPYLNILFE